MRRPSAFANKQIKMSRNEKKVDCVKLCLGFPDIVYALIFIRGRRQGCLIIHACPSANWADCLKRCYS